jgi:hypothetical protein
MRFFVLIFSVALVACSNGPTDPKPDTTKTVAKPDSLQGQIRVHPISCVGCLFPLDTTHR